MDRHTATQTIGSLAIATSYRPSRESAVRPARRVDLLVHFAGGFDLAEEQPVGHAVRVAYLASCVANTLKLGSEAQLRVLNTGLLHGSGEGIQGAFLGDDAAAVGAAWVAERFGFNSPVVDAVRAVGERWDGKGFPLGMVATDIPVEALCVSAAHWACEYLDSVEHPLRARAALQRADESELLALVGPLVTEALQEVLVQDETWLAVFGEDLPGHLARMGVGEGKPSRQRVEAAAMAMGAVVDAAFRETGRAMRISVLSRALAAGFGMSEGIAHAIGIAGHLLDVGQLGVPAQVMEKPSILTVDEMELMRRHPGIGSRLLEGIPGFGDVSEWVEQHHERPDGRGYPEMLDSDELPLPPRILAVADAYWALRAHRPYRTAYSQDEALEVMRAAAGRQFDADVLEMLPDALAVTDEVLGQVSGQLV